MKFNMNEKVYKRSAYSVCQLTTEDGPEIYEMLQRIGKEENHFQNPVHGMSYEQYKKWLKEQDDWSRGESLPQGYSPQTCFWLILSDGTPVAFGKIRHELNENSRMVGGNIGYAVDPLHRGKGFATVMLKELISIADDMGVEEKLLTVEKFNYPSKRVIEKNGGYVFKENEYRWFFHLK